MVIADFHPRTAADNALAGIIAEQSALAGLGSQALSYTHSFC